MTDHLTNPPAALAGDRLRLRFAMAGDVVGYTIDVRTGDDWQTVTPNPLPLRPFALHVAVAEPITVKPAWEPGKPETNFATFHTARAEATCDPVAAGDRLDLDLVRIEEIEPGCVECSTADRYLVTRWTVATDGTIRIAWEFTPPIDGYWSVVFPALPVTSDDNVEAILAGPFLTEKRLPAVPGVLLEGYLSAPFALIETCRDDVSLTFAIGADPVVGGWDWRTVDQARYAIGARAADGDLQLSLLSPVLGNEGSRCEVGETLSFQLVVDVVAGTWWDAWRHLAVETYGLRSYRENIYGSLTETIHNMVDLLKDDEYSGWIERGRGLLNIEHRGGVKLASPGAVLSAALLTGDRELLGERALPILEYSLSRSHYGFTWEPGSKTVGQEHVRQAFEDLGGPAWDAPVLIALEQLARGYTPALGELALASDDGIEDFYIRRSDFQVSLSLYHLTGDGEYLERACLQADAYIELRIATLANDPVEGQRFLIHIGSDWFSLLDLWEASGERRYLDAAEKGARWFAAMLWLQPVPDPAAAQSPVLTTDSATIHHRATAFERHMMGNHTSANSWIRDAVDYPRGTKEVPQDEVPAWFPSPVGMSFEAWCTYQGRMVQNPGWAAYLLRLAEATGDDLYRTLAENAVVGRFTNYPGYYQYMSTAVHAQPDFPYLGPMDLTSIYYHHIPPQIGLAIDFLFEQVRDRSGGRVSFPVVRDDSYVQFRHHLPGHRAGRFYDIPDAWPWLPQGLVSLDTHLVNWVAAVSTDGTRLGIALANTSSNEVTTNLRLDRARLHLDEADRPRVTVIDAAGDPIATATPESDLAVTIPARGLVSVRLDDVRVDEPWHRVTDAASRETPAIVTLAENDPHLGTIRAMVVGMNPDLMHAYAFTTLGPEDAASFAMIWSDNGNTREVTCDRFPFEVSVPMTGDSFEFLIAITDLAGNRFESAPARLTVPDPGANGEGGTT